VRARRASLPRICPGPPIAARTSVHVLAVWRRVGAGAALFASSMVVPFSATLSRSRQRAVEEVRGADQPQVGERLGEVAEVLALGAELLRVESHVIGEAEHLGEREPRLAELPRTRQALDVPE